MMGTPTVFVGIPPVIVMAVIEATLIVLIALLPNVVALGVPTALPTTSDVVVTLAATTAALKPGAIQRHNKNYIVFLI